MLNNENIYQTKNYIYRYAPLFEGVSEPVYYNLAYPTHLFDGNRDEIKTNIIMGTHGRVTSWGLNERRSFSEYNSIRERFNYIHGLKYKNPKYLDESQKYDNQKRLDDFHKYHSAYLDDLNNFISNVVAHDKSLAYGILTIPSSRQNEKNVVTVLVNELVHKFSFDTNVFDLSSSLFRAQNKVEAHQGGNRDRESNLSTLGLRNLNNFNKVQKLIIVDDVVTSGNSFEAVYEFLRKNNITLPIVNFAFGRSMDARSQPYYDSSLGHVLPRWGRIDGIVYDLDQTLIDSSRRNDSIEKILSGKHTIRYKKQAVSTDSTEYYADFLKKHPKIYTSYSGVIDLQKQGIPFAIVTNSSAQRAQLLMQTSSLQSAIYPAIWASHYSDKQSDVVKNIYSKYYGSNSKEAYPYIYNHSLRYTYSRLNNIFAYDEEKPGKPAPDRVIDACRWIAKHSEEKPKRIIGVGNTCDDITAYNAAGIESVLGLWGVPESLKKIAKNKWNATYVFNTFEEFKDWVNGEASSVDNPIDGFKYDEMALYNDSDDPKITFDDQYEKQAYEISAKFFNYAGMFRSNVSWFNSYESIRMYNFVETIFEELEQSGRSVYSLYEIAPSIALVESLPSINWFGFNILSGQIEIFERDFLDIDDSLLLQPQTDEGRSFATRQLNNRFSMVSGLETSCTMGDFDFENWDDLQDYWEDRQLAIYSKRARKKTLKSEEAMKLIHQLEEDFYRSSGYALGTTELDRLLQYGHLYIGKDEFKDYPNLSNLQLRDPWLIAHNKINGDLEINLKHGLVHL